MVMTEYMLELIRQDNRRFKKGKKGDKKSPAKRKKKNRTSIVDVASGKRVGSSVKTYSSGGYVEGK
jgi:hypothetical protein